MTQLSHGFSRPPVVKLISFGAGRLGIRGALNRLKRQALATNWFDEIELLDESHLDDMYHSMFATEVTRSPKGFGFWAWKPYLINQHLSKLQEGDILIYLDAGVEINAKGKGRFNFYLDYLARKDVLLFSLSEQNREWTKSAVSQKIDRNFFFRNQLMATVIMLKKSDLATELAGEWLELCAHNRGESLRDADSVEFRKDGEILEHRHDQSLLSLAAFAKNIESIPDETVFSDWRESQPYPFLALRNSAGSKSIMWLIQHFPISFARFWLRLTLSLSKEVMVGKVKKLFQK